MSRLSLSFDILDEWRSLASLAGAADGRVLTEGVIMARTSALYLRFQPQAPGSAETGVLVTDGAAVGLGPASSIDAGYPAGEVWVRNRTPGSTARVEAVGSWA